MTEATGEDEATERVGTRVDGADDGTLRSYLLGVHAQMEQELDELEDRVRPVAVLASRPGRSTPPAC